MGEFCKRHRGERDTFIEYRMRRPQPITTTTKGVKEYEDGWHTQGVLRRMVNKTGINDKGLAGVRKMTLLCMMGLGTIGALYIKRFWNTPLI